MRTRGDLGNVPIADVPARSPQLWRSQVFETFDGTTWTAERIPAAVSGRGRVQLPPDPLDEGAAPAAERRTDTVRTLRGFTGLVLAPGTPTGITSGGRVIRLGAARVFIEDLSGYAVTTGAPETDSAVLATAGAAPDPDRRWLQLPDALPCRVAISPSR
jgi:hypothetical protein